MISRSADGNVPNANWNDSTFKVNWNGPDNRNDDLCSCIRSFGLA